ncbi:protein takeout [Bombyx mori]|uniref:Juvenile hormone binding protein n=1 Tax=Bombyx mori TaxID=7091 RepID=A0A8R2AR89_BOMMO|nr:protein takeout [Bombyx mori]
MFNYFFTIAIFIALSSYQCYARVAPDFIKICPGQKSECLKSTVQETIPIFSKGIPSLNIEPIDPLKQDKVVVELPGGFKVELLNGTVTGFRNCIVDSVSYNDEEAEMKFHCNLTIKGKYKAKGQILIVSINGDGDAKIKITDVALMLKVKFEDVERDGEVYQEVKSYSLDYKNEGRVTFFLTNLFKGNPEISKAVLSFINENWRQLTEEFGKPVVDELVRLVFEVVKKFFTSIPKKELFVD